MSTPTTPTTVEPGQIWRDNDQRTKGSGGVGDWQRAHRARKAVA